MDTADVTLAGGGQGVEVGGAGAGASTTPDSSSEEIVPASITIALSAEVHSLAAKVDRGAAAV